MVIELSHLLPPPGEGMMTVCEDEAILRSNTVVGALRAAQDLMGYGEPIVQSESQETVRPAFSQQDAQHCFTAKPRLPQSLAAAYHERGFRGCVEHLATKSTVFGFLAAALLKTEIGALNLLQAVNMTKQLPRRAVSITGTGKIISISWHKACRRLAVAYSDDCVRILSSKPLQPLLKHRSQRLVSQVCWLPYSMHVVCVSCEAGVLLWSVDPSSVVTRPSGACITLLPCPSYPSLSTVMSVHPKGTLLACSGGEGVSIWDTSLATCVQVQHSGPVSSVLYSPDSTMLLVVMSKSPRLRVFNTNDWSFEEYASTDIITSCVWSPCSRHVVFACASDSGSSVLYGVSVDGAMREAALLADLSPVQLLDTDQQPILAGGTVSQMQWQGERLVVLFRDSPYVALFHASGLSISRGGFIKGPDDCLPVTAAFRDSCPRMLTIVWNDHTLQHVPLLYACSDT